MWLTYARCPLDGIEFVDFQQGIQVVHGAYTVQVVESVVYLLALFADEWLYKAAIVIYTDHGRDVTLQL